MPVITELKIPVIVAVFSEAVSIPIYWHSKSKAQIRAIIAIKVKKTLFLLLVANNVPGE